MWDIGGQERIRPLWMYYLHGTHALEFVIDCNERDRIEEARLEMQHILQQQELENAVLLVLANKQAILCLDECSGLVSLNIEFLRK